MEPSSAPAVLRARAFCRSPRTGPCCQHCGQASVEAPRSLHDVLAGQSGKLVYTLRTLFLRPGELACAVDEGRDRRAVRPVTLLLNLITLFFLLGAGAGGFSARTFLDTLPDKGQAILAKRSAAPGVPVAVMAKRVEQRFRSVHTVLTA
jgi:hypothetical protein